MQLVGMDRLLVFLSSSLWEKKPQKRQYYSTLPKAQINLSNPQLTQI